MPPSESLTVEPLRFVVNRHHATTLHFDLRLEVEGVLVSWAVPKGPSLDPKAKRLAVQVDDHGMEHLDLEGRSVSDTGRIQTKIVWDTGTYQPAEPPGAALERGHLRFVLAGHKLEGAFALTRTRMGGNERSWILVKIDDEYADPDRDPAATENESVLTGVTNEELADRPSGG
jgi:DNA ligase D-like protein (predicted 3'-phosphoesterase)